MRTAFVSTGSQIWGTNYRILGLARNAYKLGLDAHVLLPDIPDNRKWFPEGHSQGVPVHFTKAGSLSEPRSKYEVLRGLRPRFVHCAGVVRPCFPAALAYRATHSCELIVDFDEHLSRIKMNGTTRRLYYLFAENLARRYADRLVVASRFLERWFGQLQRQPVLYLPNAVELDSFWQQQSGWQELKARWGGRKVVTYFGALSPHYDADIVFDAAVRLLGRRNDLVFVFVGAGEMLASLRARVHQAGQEDSIEFCGFVPDDVVPQYLSAADVLVFPIRDNWWNRARCPGKVYSFTAAMVPIVTNSVGEVREALGESAWYFKDGDVEDLENVLEQCLAAGRNVRCPDSKLAARHCWRERAESYLEFLDGGSVGAALQREEIAV
jgi:glycosyltransferase involved in cell wall biosynthesis